MLPTVISLALIMIVMAGLVSVRWSASAREARKLRRQLRNAERIIDDACEYARENQDVHEFAGHMLHEIRRLRGRSADT